MTAAKRGFHISGIFNARVWTACHGAMAGASEVFSAFIIFIISFQLIQNAVGYDTSAISVVWRLPHLKNIGVALTGFRSVPIAINMFSDAGDFEYGLCPPGFILE